MNDFKENMSILLLAEDFKLYDNVYRLTYNSVKHFVELTDSTIRIYSFKEGTADEFPFKDTGVINIPSITFVKTLITNLKNLKQTDG